MNKKCFPHFERNENVITINNGEKRLEISLLSPEFLFERQRFEGTAPILVLGELAGGQIVEAHYAPKIEKCGTLEMILYLQWCPDEFVLRKWARFRFISDALDEKLCEIVLEKMDLNNTGKPEFNFMYSEGTYAVQSFPVFFSGFFAGVEFPVASTRREGDTLLFAFRPGIGLKSGQWVETHKAIVGVCKEGYEKKAFDIYIARHSVRTKGIHFNYNSWWTSPVPYNENDILTLMQTFKENLYDQYCINIDTFSIDLGWSNPHSIWEIDQTLFPQGFLMLQDKAESMNSRLGLWVSPGACYNQALDNTWAIENGYEAYDTVIPDLNDYHVPTICLGGTKYKSEFIKNFTEIIRSYGICHVKLDGLGLVCNEETHVHLPGAYSSDAIVSGATELFDAMRHSGKDIWLETTCLGYNPSPWWLFHVSSVIGSIGDDARSGRIPAPVARESYTTERDFYYLQSADRFDIPTCAQEVLGIVHQSPDCFMNDAITTLMRGHAFIPLYINPKYMNENRWLKLARLMQWAKTHPGVCESTETLLPVSWQNGAPKCTSKAVMPREPYGFAHWNSEPGGNSVTLRNPWIKPCEFSIKLPIDLPYENDGLYAVSIYPEHRVYGAGLKGGDTINLHLAPYETLVLSFEQECGCLEAANSLLGKLRIVNIHLNMLQDDLQLKAEIIAESLEDTELLIYIEGGMNDPVPESTVCLNNQSKDTIYDSSQQHWASQSYPAEEFWQTLRMPFEAGRFSLGIDLKLGAKPKRISAWLLTSKAGVDECLPYGTLPQPEKIYIDAVEILDMMN